MIEWVVFVIRVILGALLLAGLAAVLWRVAMGGDMHPDDADKPLHKQRVKIGSPFRERIYGERSGVWMGLGCTLGPAAVLMLTAAVKAILDSN